MLIWIIYEQNLFEWLRAECAESIELKLNLNQSYKNKSECL